MAGFNPGVSWLVSGILLGMATVWIPVAAQTLSVSAPGDLAPVLPGAGIAGMPTWTLVHTMSPVLGAVIRPGSSEVFIHERRGLVTRFDAAHPERQDHWKVPQNLVWLLPSPGGGIVLAGTEEARLVALDARTGASGRGWEGSRATFSSDGRFFLTGIEEGLIRLVEVSSGRILKQFSHPGWRSFAFAPGDRLIVILEVDTPLTRRVVIREIGSGEVVGAWKGVRGWSGPTFSRDGQAALFPMQDRTVLHWTSQDRQIRHVWTHAGTVQSVEFSREGDRLLTGAWDRTVVARSSMTGETLWTSPFIDLVASAAFDDTGRFALVLTVDLVAHMLDAKDGQVLKSWSPCIQARFLPGASSVLLQDPAGEWRIIVDPVSGQPSQALPGGEFASSSSDGRVILTWSPGGSASIRVHRP